MSKNLKKLQPRIKNYQSCKNFSNKKFKNCFLNELRKEDFVNNNKEFEKLCNISMKNLLHGGKNMLEVIKCLL